MIKTEWHGSESNGAGLQNILSSHELSASHHVLLALCTYRINKLDRPVNIKLLLHLLQKKPEMIYGARDPRRTTFVDEVQPKLVSLGHGYGRSSLIFITTPVTPGSRLCATSTWLYVVMVTTGFSFHIYEELELQVYDKNSAPPNTTPSPNCNQLVHNIRHNSNTVSYQSCERNRDRKRKEQTGWFI